MGIALFLTCNRKRDHSLYRRPPFLSQHQLNRHCMIDKKIQSFAHRFLDRLNGTLIDGVSYYVDNGENSLAFEVLCDHLSEYQVDISSNEYDEAAQLVSQLGLDINTPPFKHLKELKKR